MKYFVVFAMHFFLLASAAAEPFMARDGPAHPTAPEQRRAALRLVLHGYQAPMAAQPTESPDSLRRLSDQERAALRHQLRRQRQDDPSRMP